MDDVSFISQRLVTVARRFEADVSDRGIPSYSLVCPGPAHQSMERDYCVKLLVTCDSKIAADETRYHTAKAPKRIYYLSIEWLIGRSLDNAVLNLGMRNTYEDATRKLGFVSNHPVNNLKLWLTARISRTCLIKSEMLDLEMVVLGDWLLAM